MTVHIVRREELLKVWTMGGVQLAQVLTLFLATAGMPRSRSPGPLLWTLMIVSSVQNSLSHRYHWSCASTARDECPTELCAQFVTDTWGIVGHAGAYTLLILLALAPMCPPGLAGVAVSVLVVWGVLTVIHTRRVQRPETMATPEWPETSLAHRALVIPSGCVLIMLACAAYAAAVCRQLVPLWVFVTLSYACASYAQVHLRNGGVWCHVLLVGANCACMWMLYLLESGWCCS